MAIVRVIEITNVLTSARMTSSITRDFDNLEVKSRPTQNMTIDHDAGWEKHRDNLRKSNASANKTMLPVISNIPVDIPIVCP